MDRWLLRRVGVVVIAFGVGLGAVPAHAQHPVWELGIDAGAVFGLGDISSVSVDLPASRFRAGYFVSERWSIEPAVGLGYDKVENQDGLFTYDLQLGALYHFTSFAIVSQESGSTIANVNAAYLRPFVGYNGFTGTTDDSEFSLGAGVGIKLPWKNDLAWRFEGNFGYGFDNEAFRLGLLMGVSFFTH